MKKNKVLIFGCIAIVFLVLFYCFRESKQEYIAKQIDVKMPEVSDMKYTDNHRGFHGDGEAFGKIEFDEVSGKEFLSQVADNKSWNELPLTENLNLLMYGGETNHVEYTDNFAQKLGIPEITTGYWFFLDRNSESNFLKSDANLVNRSSLNFTLALYDVDTNVLYYFEFDT